MKALLLVDIQNDFLPGGALGVKDGDQIIPIIQKILESQSFDLIIATKDWHPQDHTSFAATHQNKQVGDKIMVEHRPQILWPVHCVQNTFGAEFGSGWDTSKIDLIFHKGTNPSIDSYSAFYDNSHLRSTGLGEYLKEKGIQDVYIAGLATDYCIKYSALDALHAGFQVYVFIDACRGAELQPGDCDQAILDMQAQGAHIIHS
jgi:nicotinamidase/pyrazinamidase